MAYIHIDNQKIEVTDEIYQAYHENDRFERYCNHDRKTGRFYTDIKNEKVIYVESKEDSIERLSEDEGVSFTGADSAEDEFFEAFAMRQLMQAVSLLDEEERALIERRYIQRKTFRDISSDLGISHTAVQKRHNTIIKKLQKYFGF